MEFDLDPLFRNTSKFFDDASSCGLLLNVMPINKKIVIRFGEDCKQKGEHFRERPTNKIKCNYLKELGKPEFRNQGLEEEWVDLLPELLDFKQTVIEEQRISGDIPNNEIRILRRG